MKKLLSVSLLFPLLGGGCSFISSQETACAYDGVRYEVGDSFPATDGCNTCSCQSDGSIACTEIACAVNNGIDECEIASDCEAQGIDTSFCSTGEWSCIDSKCEFSCDISDML